MLRWEGEARRLFLCHIPKIKSPRTILIGEGSVLPDLLSDKPAGGVVANGHKTHLLRESVSSDSQESTGGGKQFCWYVKQSHTPVMKKRHSQAMLRSLEEIACDQMGWL